MPTPQPTDPCAGCRVGDRRAFLREVAAALGALAALGLAPDEAAGLDLRRVTGRRETGCSDCRYPVPAADGASIDQKHQVILVRYHGMGYAFALSCPHQNTALRWVDAAQRFQCPKHKSQYQPDGTFITGRATRNMDRLPIRLEGGELVVDADHVFESDKDPVGWGAAQVTL
jgi:nitrite reductase/ring-hydroxylating ferredoxin subunit